jgi:formylglycine-generating enzyme required for sulfatase activity
MGDPDLVLHGYNGYEAFTNDIERPVHAVTLAAPWWMGKFVVTQAQYQAVMGASMRWSRMGPGELGGNSSSAFDPGAVRLKRVKGDWRLVIEAEGMETMRKVFVELPLNDGKPG